MFEKEAVDKITQQFGTSGEYNTRIRIWQDGAEFGFQKGIKAKINTTTISDYPFKNQWHKVSEQIPTEEKDYIVKLTDETVDVMTVALDGNLEPYLLSPEFDFYKDVEKWCEIPKENE